MLRWFVSLTPKLNVFLRLSFEVWIAQFSGSRAFAAWIRTLSLEFSREQCEMRIGRQISFCIMVFRLANGTAEYSSVSNR